MSVPIRSAAEILLEAQIAREPVVLTENALDRAMGRAHDRLFSYLFGDATDFAPLLASGRVTRSELDLEFAKLVAQYATRDASLIATIMEESPQARPKWKTKRGPRTWLDQTIAIALRKAPDHTAVLIPKEIERDEGPLDVSVRDLADDPALLELPEALSPWLVWHGQVSVLIGREKLAGKSTLAASDAAGAVRAGHTVLWIDAEQGHHRIVSRFVDLGLAPGTLDRIIVLKRWPRSWEEVEATITKRQPDVIYVDSLAAFLMAVEGKVPDTSEGEAWQALVGRFKTWTTLAPCGVCVLLHATKADGNYRGSTGIGAAPDLLITMKTPPDDAMARWLEIIGRWSFPSRAVRFAGEARGYIEGLGTAPVAATPRINETRRKILNALTRPVTWGEWRAACEGMTKNAFNHSVRWLREQGFVNYDDATGEYSRAEFAISQEPPVTDPTRLIAPRQAA